MLFLMKALYVIWRTERTFSVEVVLLEMISRETIPSEARLWWRKQWLKCFQKDQWNCENAKEVAVWHFWNYLFCSSWSSFVPSSLFLRSVVCTDGDTSSPSPLLRIHGDFGFVCDIWVNGMFWVHFGCKISVDHSNWFIYLIVPWRLRREILT